MGKVLDEGLFYVKAILREDYCSFAPSNSRLNEIYQTGRDVGNVLGSNKDVIERREAFFSNIWDTSEDCKKGYVSFERIQSFLLFNA